MGKNFQEKYRETIREKLESAASGDGEEVIVAEGRTAPDQPNQDSEFENVYYAEMDVRWLQDIVDGYENVFSKVLIIPFFDGPPAISIKTHSEPDQTVKESIEEDINQMTGNSYRLDWYSGVLSMSKK